jgi:TPR repeat protein
MKLNRLACSFLYLLLILALHGHGQGMDATSAEKTPIVATTNNSTDSGNDATRTFNEIRVRAERGDAKAQFDLGCAYVKGDGLAKDEVEAVKWYRKAAEQGNPDAQFALSFCYYNGVGVAKEEEEAAKWLFKAANQGNPLAQFDLGSMYHNGDGVVKDEEEAVKWWRKAANQGDADAQNNLGAMYYNGKGVPKDLAEAAKWHQKAADQGLADAQLELGRLYSSGRGVPQNYQKAAEMFRMAAEQGNADAQGVLGYCYWIGQGLPKDFTEAYKWFNLASAQGNEKANKGLSAIEGEMTPGQIAEAQRLAREFKPRKETPSSSFDNTTSPDSPTATGTGFFITDDGYLITNNHVVKDATKVRLVTSMGLIDAKVVRVDVANDLALLKAAGRFSPLPVAASRGVKLGGTVATVGFPNIGLQGFSPKLAKGEIASLSGAADDARYFQISVPVQPGNSGGALVDERGNVIGIVSAKLDASVALAASGALPENVNYAVKSSFLLSFLESVPAVSARLKEPITADRKFEDVVKSAQDAAVLVLVY